MKSMIISFLLAVTSVVSLLGQQLKISVVNAETGKPLEGVEVFSHEAHNNINYTDKIGSVIFDIKHTDTLILFKQSYHPLYIQIKRLNFDTTHLLVLKMVPSGGESHGYMTRQFDKLEKSEYHFEHDSLSNSSIKVTSFKSPTLQGVPKYRDRAFHFAEIGIDKPNSSRSKSSYLKKED